VSVVASPLWLLWLLAPEPATEPADARTGAPAEAATPAKPSATTGSTPEGPALPAGTLPAGAVPAGAVPVGVPGGIDMDSPEWVAPTATRRRKPLVGQARVDRMSVTAHRIDDKDITIDGHLTEAAWKAVPLVPEMVQAEPRFGFHPTVRTDVRVAYGQRGIYVAFLCYGDPKKVRPGVFRKDQIGPSDLVFLEIDPNNNDTNGYVFVTNPSGSQEDAQLFRDDSEELLWDGVWHTAGKITPQGWTSEIFVPWSTIRFESRDEYTFGVNVGRWVNETGELDVLSPIPQGLPGRISWALDYKGVKGIEPGLNLELRPFISSRIAARRPEDTLDHSTPFLPNGGFDVKYGLRGNLTLDVAVNPDFGQAEVDPAVLNLGPFEVFFPERRQFFLESKEIFETRFQLFYSRRIGNNPRPARADLTTRGEGDRRETGQLTQLDPLTRIFGALRLTGQAAKSWSVGAMTATTGATFGTERFSDGTTHRVTVDPTSQYSVFRVRKEFNSQTSVGAIATGVVRGGGEPSAFAGGFDYRIRFLDRWRHSAQVIGTNDGQRTGMGAGFDLRRSVKNLSWLTNLDMLTPHANFNDLGFMRLNNYIDGNTALSVYNAQPVGKLRQITGTVDTRVASSFQGDLLQKQLTGQLGLTTLSLWEFGANTGGHLPQYDLYETRGGIPYEVPLHWWTGLDITSPDNRRVVGAFNGAYGEQNGRPGPDVALELRLRPINRLELTLRGDFNATFNRPRWTTTNAFGEPVFGRAKVISYTGVLRGTLGILPNLTLQSFNQLYYLSAHHDQFYILTAPNVLLPTDPTPYYGQVDQGLSSFISNSILRWEYLPGSFLFVVYTHRTSFSEGGAGTTPGGGPIFFRPGSGFSNLVAYRAQDEDIIFIKLQHLFGL
jgi:hypothetical protein